MKYILSIILIVIIFNIYSINILYQNPSTRVVRTIVSDSCDCAISYRTTTVPNFDFAGDTSEADTSDIVCMNDTLWEYKRIGTILKTNSGWYTYITEGYLDLLSDCERNVTDIEYIDSISCDWFTPSQTLSAPDNTNDTIFLYSPISFSVNCVHDDSGAVYSDGENWHGVCDFVNSWEVKEYGGDCYTVYDSTFVIFDGETLFLIDSLIGGY